MAPTRTGRVGSRSRSRRLGLLRLLFAVHAVKEGRKDNGRAAIRAEGYVVPEYDRGDDHADHLPRRHDNRESNGAEIFDGVEDERLAGRGRNSCDDIVPNGARVRS